VFGLVRRFASHCRRPPGVHARDRPWGRPVGQMQVLPHARMRKRERSDVMSSSPRIMSCQLRDPGSSPWALSHAGERLKSAGAAHPATSRTALLSFLFAAASCVCSVRQSPWSLLTNHISKGFLAPHALTSAPTAMISTADEDCEHSEQWTQVRKAPNRIARKEKKFPNISSPGAP
jgi:hypothetical protein